MPTQNSKTFQKSTLDYRRRDFEKPTSNVAKPIPLTTMPDPISCVEDSRDAILHDGGKPVPSVATILFAMPAKDSTPSHEKSREHIRRDPEKPTRSDATPIVRTATIAR
jgi:hypothetical protein